MIEITRKTAKQVRAVFRRALGLHRRSGGPVLTLVASSDGLRIRAGTSATAIEFHERGPRRQEQIALPFDFFANCEGGQDDPVQVEDAESEVIASWSHKGVPQVMRYEPATSASFPDRPSNMAATEPRLLAAVHEASTTAEMESTRYALNCVELSHDGKVAGTDGRHLFVESGLAFPWTDDVLIPRTTVFGLREFIGVEDVSIGKTNQWLAIRAGPWTTFFHMVKDARFPRVCDHIPQRDSITTTMRLAEDDAEFLYESMPGLPCDDDLNRPLTLDLNGAVIVRASAGSRAAPSELLLSNSTTEGEPLRINTNRRFVERAARLGFRCIGFRGEEAPAACIDSNRTLVWALLGKDGVVKPSRNAIRIESPHNPNSHQTIPRKESNESMPQNRIDQNGHAARSANGATEVASVDDLIEQADSLKSLLREAATVTSQLVVALKQHRKKSKTVRSAIASLKELEALHV